MYKIYSKEQEDLSIKRWITITKEDALNFKTYANLDNLKYVVQIYKKVLEDKQSSDLIVIEEEELMNFILNQDWLYDYDVFNQLSFYEVCLAKNKLENLLKIEEERFNELMHATLPSDEYIAILEYLLTNINKYKYQLYSVDKLIKEKKLNGDFNIETKIK